MVEGRHFGGTMITKRDNDDGKPTQLRDDLKDDAREEETSRLSRRVGTSMMGEE